MKRRKFFEIVPASLSAIAVLESGAATRAAEQSAKVSHFKQGFTRQVFGLNVSTEECCRQAVQIGFQGFDFADDPADWPILKKYGIAQSMYRFPPPRVSPAPPPGTRPPGWDAIGWKEAQGAFLTEFHSQIDLAAANGFPRMLLQAGGRDDTHSYEQGADNAVEFINMLKSHVEDKGITLCLEILNSKGQGIVKVNLFDKMSWGIDVIKRVNSPNVKILYDVFQAQLTEGNIVQTIRDNFQYLAHIHTGGVPGRHQIDETQELNYGFIAHALADLGYSGFVTHEWSPAPGSDPFAAAKRSFDIMNV